MSYHFHDVDPSHVQGPPAYNTNYGVSSESAPLLHDGRSATTLQPQPSTISHSQGLSLRLGNALRVSQILLYVIAYLQLVIASVAICVFAYHVNDSEAFHPGVIATMVNDVVVLVCAAVGLAAGSHRSRVVMAALIILSVFTMTQGCIVIDFYSDNCYGMGTTYFCSQGPVLEQYTLSDYQMLLANLGVNVATTIVGAVASAYMLLASCLRKDTTP